MKKVFILSLAGLLLGSGLFSQQTDTRTNSRIESRVTTRVDPFWWGGVAGITPETPTLTLVSNEMGVTELQWTAVEPSVSIYGYYLYRDTSAGASTVRAFIKPETTSMTFYDVPTTGTYYWRVRAVSSTETYSAYSNEVTATTTVVTNLQQSLNDADVWYIADQRSGANLDDQIDGSPDLAVAFNTVYRSWEPEGNRSYVKAPGNLISDSGFDSPGSWTVTNPYIIIQNSRAEFNHAGRTEQAVISPLAANVNGALYYTRFTLSDWVGGDVEIRVGGSTTSTSRSSNGTFEELVLSGAGSNIELLSNNGVGRVDDFEVYRVFSNWGDYWSINPNTANYISDSTALDFGSVTDWALEMRISYLDWSNGFQGVFGTFGGGPDRECFVLLNGSGDVLLYYSEDGTAFGNVTFNSNVYGLGAGDGLDNAIWMRIEFDYDDGGVSRARMGISADRNGFDAWSWTAWESFGQTIDFYDGALPTYFGSENGTANKATMNIWEAYVYDGLTTTTDTFYEFSAATHEAAGGGGITNTLSGRGNQYDFLVTRPVHQSWGTANHTIPYTAGITDGSGKSYLLAMRNQIRETSSSEGRFIYQTDGSDILDIREDVSFGTPLIEGFLSDGTDTFLGSEIAYGIKEAFGLNVYPTDATPVTVNMNIQSGTTSAATSTEVFTAVDSIAMASGDLGIGGEQGELFGAAIFDGLGMSGSEFKQHMYFHSFGRWGDGDSYRTGAGALGGAGAADGGSLTPNITDVPNAVDTIVVYFSGLVLGTQGFFDVAEFGVYESVDGTGTNLAAQAALTDGSRTALPDIQGFYNTPAQHEAALAGTDPAYRIADNDVGTRWINSAETWPDVAVSSQRKGFIIYLDGLYEIGSSSVQYGDANQAPQAYAIYAYNSTLDIPRKLRRAYSVNTAANTTKQVFEW